MVGVQGFEPWTPWSQTRCATRLRHTPTRPYSTPLSVRLQTHHRAKPKFFCKYLLCAINTGMLPKRYLLPQLLPGQAFPDVEEAWGPDSPACGLLATGGALDVATLQNAYLHGIFPWFSDDQPILWWSTDPRMALQVSQFKLRRSLKQALHRFANHAHCEIRIDSAFERVIKACANSARGNPTGEAAGTWIVSDMVKAYLALHRAGFAHSVETWVNGQLVGGLYCVAFPSHFRT